MIKNLAKLSPEKIRLELQRSFQNVPFFPQTSKTTFDCKNLLSSVALHFIYVLDICESSKTTNTNKKFQNVKKLYNCFQYFYDKKLKCCDYINFKKQHKHYKYHNRQKVKLFFIQLNKIVSGLKSTFLAVFSTLTFYKKYNTLWMFTSIRTLTKWHMLILVYWNIINCYKIYFELYSSICWYSGRCFML